MVHSIPNPSYACYNNSNMPINDVMSTKYPTTYYTYKPTQMPTEYEDNNMQPRKLRRYSSPMPLSSAVTNPIPYSSTSNHVPYPGSWMSMTPTQSTSVLPAYSKPQKDLKRNYFTHSNPFSFSLDLQKTDLRTITNYNNNPFELDNTYDDCGESGEMSPPSSPLHGTSSNTGINKSAIECGSLDSNGNRIFTIDSEYFEKNVEIYVAASDPQRRVLFRASALAEKFGCATNKVGMYLSRRRNSEEGLYQASGFLFKPPGRSGLKSGGYFLSMEVCQGFEHHYCRQNHRQKIRQLRRQQAIANVRADSALSSRASDSALPDESNRLAKDESATIKMESPSNVHEQYSSQHQREFNDLSDCSSSSADNTPLQSPVSPDSSVPMSYSVSVSTVSNGSGHISEHRYYSHLPSQPEEQVPFNYTVPLAANTSYPQSQCVSADLVDTTDYNQFANVPHDFVSYDSMLVGSKMEETNFMYFDEFHPQAHPNTSSTNESDYIFGIMY